MGYLLSLQTLERSAESRDADILAVSTVSLSTCLSTFSTSICCPLRRDDCDTGLEPAPRLHPSRRGLGSPPPTEAPSPFRR